MCETIYCQDGIHVNYHGSNLHGHYEIQPIYVNDRPYFKMKTKGIWWSNGFWFIGSDSKKGQTIGQAYYTADDYCPHQLKEKIWGIWTSQGWQEEQKLFLTCKYIQITADALVCMPDLAPQKK